MPTNEENDMTELLKMTYKFINSSLVLLLSAGWLLPFSLMNPTDQETAVYLLWVGGNVMGMLCIARDFSVRWSVEQLLWHATIAPVFAFVYAWEALEAWRESDDD